MKVVAVIDCATKYFDTNYSVVQLKMFSSPYETEVQILSQRMKVRIRACAATDAEQKSSMYSRTWFRKAGYGIIYYVEVGSSGLTFWVEGSPKRDNHLLPRGGMKRELSHNFKKCAKWQEVVTKRSRSLWSRDLSEVIQPNVYAFVQFSLFN